MAAGLRERWVPQERAEAGESEIVRWMGLLPLLGLFALGLLQAWPALAAALQPGAIPIDHRIYYCSALAWTQGLDPYGGVYPPGCGDLRFRFVYPPAILDLFAVLRPDGLAPASRLLLAISASAVLTIALIARRLFLPALRPAAALPLYLLCAPAALCNWAIFGNVAVVLYALLLLGAALLLAPTPRVWPFVLALAVAASFKWILLSLLLLLPLTVGRRGLLWAGGTVAALLLLYGLDWWRAPVPFAAYVANFDIHRQLVDLGGGIATLGFDLLEALTGARDLSPAAEWFGRGLWLVALLLLSALAWLAVRARHAGEGGFDRRVRLALGLLLGILLLPRVKDYDLYLLLPPLLYLIAAATPAWPTPAALRWPLKAALLGCWAVLPYHTAVAVLAVASPLWLLAVWRGWLVLAPPDPVAVLPRPLARLLLRPTELRSR